MLDEVLKLSRSGLKPTEVAGALGFRVVFVPFKVLPGVSLVMGRYKLIFINSGLTEVERQLVCGHEVGHFLLHPAANFLFVHKKTFFYSKQEYEANLIACEMMLGERAQTYRAKAREAAASRSLSEMALKLGQLVWDPGGGGGNY